MVRAGRALGELLLAFGGKQLVDAARRRLPAPSHTGTPKAAPLVVYPEKPGSSQGPVQQLEGTNAPEGGSSVAPATDQFGSGLCSASPAARPGLTSANRQDGSPGLSCAHPIIGAHPDTEASVAHVVVKPHEQAQGSAPPTPAAAEGSAEPLAAPATAAGQVQALLSFLHHSL